MIWSKARFQHSFELLPRVLKEVAPALLPISAIIWGLEFYVSYLNKARFDNPYGSSMKLMIFVGIFGVLFQCFASVFASLFVARSTQRQMKNGVGESPWKFVVKHFHQCLIEYVRAFISVGIFSMLLIIPGIIRWVQLFFVTLVSAFDPDYQQGKKDVLQESSRLVRGAWIPLFLLVVFTMIFPLILEEMAKEQGTPLALTVVMYLISWFINLYFSIYFVLTFFARWSFKMEKA